MQIQLTITEEFGDVVSFAEFATALQAFLAGRAHHVKIGKTDASPHAVAAATRDTIRSIEPALGLGSTPETAAAAYAETVADSLEAADPAPAETAKPRRGRPPKAKTDEQPAAAVTEPSAADPFAADVATAETAIAKAAAPITYTDVRAKVLRFVELRPDRAAAASEWAKTLKEHGYAMVTEITDDREGETPAAKADRVGKIVAKLDEMIAAAEETAKAAKAK